MTGMVGVRRTTSLVENQHIGHADVESALLLSNRRSYRNVVRKFSSQLFSNAAETMYFGGFFEIVGEFSGLNKPWAPMAGP
jgi:hypothetical protein